MCRVDMLVVRGGEFKATSIETNHTGYEIKTLFLHREVKADTGLAKCSMAGWVSVLNACNKYLVSS